MKSVPLKAAQTRNSWWKSSSASTGGAGPGAVFETEIAEQRGGLAVLRISGPGAQALFQHESGGHRWQRVPPNEKRGRVHTSTITVAVLPVPQDVQLRVDERDLVWQTCRGTGSGGQKRNKTESTVQLTHTPTGIQVRCETERSQLHNRVTALALLRARLWQLEAEKRDQQRAEQRRAQVGSGMRGDKRRTIRCQDGVVIDHVLGKRWNLREYLRGEW